MSRPGLPPLPAAGAPEAGPSQCPLCGHWFTEAAESCRTCPLHHGCRTKCCPRCGYSLFGDSSTMKLLRRLGRALSGLLPGSAGGRGAA